jgi:hypothetical protein
MPDLREKALDCVLCTFNTRPSTTAAGFAKISQLSSSRQDQAERSVRAGGMDRPSRKKSHPAGSFSSSQPGGPPCSACLLAFGLIGLSLNTGLLSRSPKNSEICHTFWKFLRHFPQLAEQINTFQVYCTL